MIERWGDMQLSVLGDEAVLLHRPSGASVRVLLYDTSPSEVLRVARIMVRLHGAALMELGNAVRLEGNQGV